MIYRHVDGNQINLKVTTIIQSNWMGNWGNGYMGGWGGPWMILVVILSLLELLLLLVKNDGKRGSHVRKWFGVLYLSIFNLISNKEVQI